LFVAALNHTPPEVILAAVADTRWERPGEAQILVMEEGDRYFTTYAFRQGSWQAFGPGEPDD
jgi:uncharacterized lipoprotein